MSNITRQLVVSLLVLAMLFTFGTIGYMLIGDRSLFESLYICVVILTTVGWKEGGNPLSHAEIAWTIFLMISGIAAVLYASANVVAFFIDGQLRVIFGRRQLMNKINNLRNHYVVVGFGRMGRALCLTLKYRGVPFVLIENNERRIQEAEQLGCLFICDDAMREETLVLAGIDRASGLATCLPHDADNVFVTLNARSLNDKLTIITRAEDVRTEPKLIRAGADRVICPPLIGAIRITDLLLNPLVEDMFELDGHWPDLEILKVSLHRFPGTEGKTIDQVVPLVDTGIIVIAIVGADGCRRFSPSPDTELDRGDELVIVGPTGCVKQMVQSFGNLKAA
ncbi:MAG: NAD-binding protein [Phycisphaeraceae bacterium]